MNTGFSHAVAIEHSAPGHPESPQRILEIMSLLEAKQILPELKQFDVAQFDEAKLGRVHDAALIEQVRQASGRGGGFIDADTFTTESSYQLAIDAASATCTILDSVMTSDVKNGLAVVRPPGHHAGRKRVGGFCLFNNIAVAARQAQDEHGAERVFIVDIDVHHGNGTQDIFFDDPSVFFVSIHQYSHFFYPGTGSISEIGTGPGHGHTINVPFPPGAGDYWYLKAFEQLIWPKANEFQPDVILVSAGFDAHWIDPLASARLTLTGYSLVVRELIAMANDLCGGKIMIVLEGGYQLTALSHGVLNTIYRLTGQDKLSDPLGPSPHAEQDMTIVLDNIRSLHLPN